MKLNGKKLFLSLLLVFTAAFLGSVFTASSVSSWYASLVKPSFTPPSWVFGPVWTLLYLLMGVSLYLVWMKNFGKEKDAIYIFGAQLALNVSWSLLFFGLRSPLLALLNILLLWLAIAATIFTFHRIFRPAAYLLFPYLAWVSFAVLLNGAIVAMN